MLSIHNFNNTGDYLPLLSGVILTDIFVIFLLIRGVIQSKMLQVWYRELTLSAVIADVLIIVLGITFARYIYPFFFKEYSLLKFLLVVVGVQITHDILFYLFCTAVPRGESRILDIFKDYGKEMGVKAIMADSLMMISSVLIASYLKGMSFNANIIVLILSVYLVPYFIYSV